MERVEIRVAFLDPGLMIHGRVATAFPRAAAPLGLPPWTSTLPGGSLERFAPRNGYQVSGISKNEEPKARLRVTRRLKKEESVYGDEAEAGGEPHRGGV